MHVRKIPWRFLLPGVIFPMSIVTWVRYYLSVRAFDDSPASWYWYGGLLSACLNFPAYVYSAPAQPLHKFGITLGRLWIQPRNVMFFLLVFVFWYWVGTKVESWTGAKTTLLVRERPGRVTLILYALGVTLWIFVAVATAYDLALMAHVSSWFALRYLFVDPELMAVTEFLWSVILAVYYFRRFVRDVELKAAA
jgi:hypothetical protein